MAKSKTLKPKRAKYVFFNRSIGKKNEYVFLDQKYRTVARRVTKSKPHSRIKRISPVEAVSNKQKRGYPYRRPKRGRKR